MLNPTRASGNASPARPAVPSPEAKTAQAVQTPATAKATADGFDGVLAQSDLGSAAASELKSWGASFDPAKIAGTLKPFDILKEVRDGQVDLSVPMNAGSLSGGLVKVKPGTVMKLSAKAVNGELSYSDVKVTFEPPLDGPLWTTVPGAYVTSSGEIKANVSGGPDIGIGPKLPRNLGALADTLNGMMANGAGVDLFGMPAARTAMAGSDLVQLDKAQLSVKHATFNGNVLSLGDAGQIAIGTGSTLDISGSLADLSVKGHVDVTKLALHQDGVELSGGAGSADLDLHLTTGADGQGKVTAALDHLSLDCEHAVSTRANGDFIKLATGKLTDGSVRFEQDFQLDVKTHQVTPGTSHLNQVDVGHFEGTVEGAQLTVPDADGTAQVKVGTSTLSGNLHITPDQIHLDGTLDGHAELVDYQGTELGHPVDVKDLKLDGKGDLSFDSQTGVKLSHGAFGEDLLLNGGKLSVPGLLDLELAPGAHVHSTVTDAVVGKDGFSADFAPGTQVEAGLNSGSLHLPGLGALPLGKDSKLALDCDSLSYTSGGLPAASGKLSVTAEVDLGKIDLGLLKKIPGISLIHLDGVHATLRVDIGRFTLAKDGAFSIHDVKVGVSGAIGDLSGTLELPTV